MAWQLGERDPVLTETLRLTLACHLMEMCGLAGEERYRRVPHGAAALVGAHGDALQFRGKGGPARDTAATFNALAAGIAALADEDGGATFHGVHACTRNHPGCPNALPRGEAPGKPWWAPLAELEALLADEGFDAAGEETPGARPGRRDGENAARHPAARRVRDVPTSGGLL